MCDPVSISYAVLAITAVSTAAQYENQRKSASQTGDRLKKQEELRQNDLTRQQAQIDASARQQMNDASKAALADLAMFEVTAGEYGGGKTADRTATVSSIQRGENLATINENRSGAQVENRFSSYATTAATNGRLASINQPSLLEAGLKIAGAGLNTYSTVDAAKRAKAKQAAS